MEAQSSYAVGDAVYEELGPFALNRTFLQRMKDAGWGDDPPRRSWYLCRITSHNSDTDTYTLSCSDLEAAAPTNVTGLRLQKKAAELLPAGSRQQSTAIEHIVGTRGQTGLTSRMKGQLAALALASIAALQGYATALLKCPDGDTWQCPLVRQLKHGWAAAVAVTCSSMVTCVYFVVLPRMYLCLLHRQPALAKQARQAQLVYTMPWP